ncbi:nucleotidyltransferase family protein [Oceanomicrobium pacificus]|uniref:NTP transferase domain-containing protein n=1 Tax=Oceanomicrobium pacificus TaxID=2692916 RepID=A0A6B0TU46_9RHOB|nr:nucleotidyltransferase family protein [Oceanomicrobium pacificus]MXU64744.1 NTP transferase domain-containing protein [Oceanomicrobium pacificus]
MTPPVMIFCAGFGTRMGALTADRPKPLVEVAGRPLLDHALDLVTEAGLTRAVLNLHYKGQMIRNHLAGRAAPTLGFSDESGEILETGGGLQRALPLLEADPVMTLNPDTVWTGPNPLPRLIAAMEADPAAEAVLMVVPRARAAGHVAPGDFFVDDGLPRRRGDAPTAPFIYGGTQILRTGRLAAMPPGAFSLNRLWDSMIADGTLRAITHEGGWVDVGRPEGIALAEAELAR